jgi:hypothetical protein
MSFEHKLNGLLTRVFGQHESGDRRVWFHWQNLNEKMVGGEEVKGSPLKNGRCWFHYVPTTEDHRLGKCLHAEWSLGKMNLRAGVTVDPTDREVLLGLGVPGASLYVGLEGIRWPWLWRQCDNGRGYGDRHSIEIYVHSWAVWAHLWANDMCSSREDPWWQRLVFHIDDFFLGRQQHKDELHGNPHRIWIPLPEGEYLAEAQYETGTWWRPRWPWWPFKIERQDTKVDVLAWTGLPHEGKGENSWDCGTDGLFGYTAEGHSLPRAIAKGVESTLRDRKRYGGSKPGSYPSPLVDHELGLKRFAEYAARITKIHQQNPKWPKVICSIENTSLDRVIITVNRGDGHRSCMVVTQALAPKWKDLLDEAMKTVKVEEEEAAEAS